MTGTVYVGDLSEAELAAVVRLTSPLAVSAATGLHIAYLTTLSGPGAPPAFEADGCPGCGHPSTTRYTNPWQRCVNCRRAMRDDRISRARNVLATGLRGAEARLAVMESERCSAWVARGLMTAAAKQMGLRL